MAPTLVGTRTRHQGPCTEQLFPILRRCGTPNAIGLLRFDRIASGRAQALGTIRRSVWLSSRACDERRCSSCLGGRTYPSTRLCSEPQVASLHTPGAIAHGTGWRSVPADVVVSTLELLSRSPRAVPLYRLSSGGRRCLLTPDTASNPGATTGIHRTATPRVRCAPPNRGSSRCLRWGLHRDRSAIRDQSRPPIIRRRKRHCF